MDFFSFFPSGSPNGLFLTDFNRLEPSKNSLSSFVCGIIDHHQDEEAYISVCGDARQIEMVGSATTLVAERYLRDAPHLIKNSPKFKTFLIAPIVVDTLNFDPAKFKVTPKDVDVASRLCALCRRAEENRKLSHEIKRESGAGIEDDSPNRSSEDSLSSSPGRPADVGLSAFLPSELDEMTSLFDKLLVRSR